MDSLLYIIRIFFQSHLTMDLKSPLGMRSILSYMDDPRFSHAKLASNCCVALGKAHIDTRCCSFD